MIPNQSLLNKYSVFSKMDFDNEEKAKSAILKIQETFENIHIGKTIPIMENFVRVTDFLSEVNQYGSHVFRIDEDILGLLNKTDAEVFYKPLPFFQCYIDNEIIINEKLHLFGMFLLDLSNDIYFNYFLQKLTVEQENYDKFRKSNVIIGMVKIKLNDEWNLFPFFDIVTPEMRFDGNKEILMMYPNFYKEVENFAYCFLEFLNQHDIELVNHQHSDEENKKLMNKGKLPKKITTTVRITGKLKIYLDSLRNQFGGHIDFSHKFWVRGHFRILKAEKYKEAKGKKIWIMPFIKGKGMLVEKIYELKNKQ